MLAEANQTNQSVQPKGEFIPPSREQIQALQNAMFPIQCEMPQAEHFFAPGMYGRRFTMPAGMLVVGKIHKHGHLMMVLKGHAIVITEFGREEVSAGYVSVSQPGAKRVVLAIEETVFMTVHVNKNDSQNMEEIETEHILPESEYSNIDLALDAAKEYLK